MLKVSFREKHVPPIPFLPFLKWYTPLVLLCVSDTRVMSSGCHAVNSKIVALFCSESPVLSHK